MLIPNYRSDVRRNWLENSSHRQVYRAHRPVVKEKLRNSAPTVSFLLIGTTSYEKCSDPEIAVAFSVHGIPEKSSITEPLTQMYQADSICSNNSKSSAMSHRTEDICVREDEDGNRSHLCPFDKIQDSDKEDAEAEPDTPMKFDYDIDQLIKGYCLKSDDIPCLQAERPPASDSDETNSSDVDSSTAMIYAPLSNSSFTKFCDSHLYYPSHEAIFRGKRLDNETIARWNEDSSDDNEYYINGEGERDLLLQNKFTAGDESDMEEFMETPEIENAKCKKLQTSHSDNEREKILTEMIMDDNEQTNGINTTKYSQLISDNNNLKNSHSAENDDSSSKLQHFTKVEPKTHILKNNDSFLISKNKECKLLTSNRLPTEENAEDRDMKEILKLSDYMLDSVSKIICMKDSNLKLDSCSGKDSASSTSEISATIEKNDEITAAVTLKNTTVECDKENKSDNLGIRISDKNNDQNVPADHQVLPKPDSEINDKSDERKNDLSEPTVSRAKRVLKDKQTQPDLATALRFMTEVYPSKDERELYSDTLSMSDVPVEVTMTEKSGAVISGIYRDIHREETTDRSSNVNIKSPNESRGFEPVITEEERTVTRPRNKFSKFIKSVKRRLVKKA